MKATGVIRRIDNLGRIVIPKEIRKNLRIKSGDNLEIFINEKENIILTKYNQIDKLKDIAKELVNSIYYTTKNNVFITNTSSVIASNEKKQTNKEISEYLTNIIKKRQILINEGEIKLIENNEDNTNYAIFPIIANGDIFGSIVMTSKKQIDDINLNIIKTASKFLSNHIEG